MRTALALLLGRRRWGGLLLTLCLWAATTHAQQDETRADASTASPASAASQPASRGQPVVWQLEIDAPPPLDKLLRTYLDLARFQTETAQDRALNIRRSELRRLVAAAPDQAKALLEAEGYFNATVHVKVGDAQPGQVVMVSVRVDPGPRTRISDVQFVFEGDLDKRLGQNDPVAQRLLARLQVEWGLQRGEVFRQSIWSTAKNAALARIRADGYPTATWSGTSVTVDPASHTARLYLVADSGPAYVFGQVRVEGLSRQPASAITNLAPFKPGAPYSEKQLLDWQDRIQKLNLFDTVFVTTDQDAAQASTTPVLVQVHEMPLQTATAGIGVSSDTGPRVSAEYLHRNVFDLGWQAKIRAQLGNQDSVGSLDLISHPWTGGRRGLVSGQASYIVDNEGTATSSQQWRVGQLREGQRLERTDYVELQRAQVRASDGLVVSNAAAAAVTSQWIFRDVDSLTLPTRGTTSLAAITGGRTYSAQGDEGYFGRLYAKAVGYLPLWAGWRGTARAELGQVLARDEVNVPDTLLFRAGGEDSIRGYDYRSIGVEKDGVIVGGRVIALGSAEVAHVLTHRMPSLLGALFVDAGDVSDRVASLSPKVGYGMGLRWLSPVGALRLDTAYGVQAHRWRLQFSVGVAL